MKTRIHVNQHNIKANAKGANLPVLTVKTYLTNTLCNGVEFTRGRIVYAPDKPLSCGARVWIETDEPVTILEQQHEM